MESAVDVFENDLSELSDDMCKLSVNHLSKEEWPGAHNPIRKCIHCEKDTGVSYHLVWAFDALRKAGLEMPCVCRECHTLLHKACEQHYKPDYLKTDVMGI